MGGGAILDIGVYNIQLISLIFGGERPIKIAAGGHLNEDGVDLSSSATLIYSGGRTATTVAHGRVRMQNEAHIIGTKGMIKVRIFKLSTLNISTNHKLYAHLIVQVPMRFWCPTELETPSGIHKFDLPPTDKEFNYANSVGLCYEAAEVRRCIQAGLTESPGMSWEESLVVAEIMEGIRKQVGVIYPQDDE